MRVTSAFGLGLFLATWASTAFAWGNLETHPRLVRLPADAARGGPVGDYLREQLGLERGIDEKLAVHYGLGPKAIDDELDVTFQESRGRPK